MQIRVGLNSGEVVVRAIGSDLHMDYTAVGQTTHLAARMEQLARPGSTLLAPETRRLTEGYPRRDGPRAGAEQGRRRAGRGVRADRGGPGALPPAGGGRARAHAASWGARPSSSRLREALDARAARARARLVALVGEPGVGKSRARPRVRRRRRGCEAATVLEGRPVVVPARRTAVLPVHGRCCAATARSSRRDDGADHPREGRRAARWRSTARSRPRCPALLALADLDARTDAGVARARSAAAPAPHAGRGAATAAGREPAPAGGPRGGGPALDRRGDPGAARRPGGPAAAARACCPGRPTGPSTSTAGAASPATRRSGSSRSAPARRRTRCSTRCSAPIPRWARSSGCWCERTDGNPLFLEESVRALVETEALVGRAAAPTASRSRSQTVQVPATRAGGARRPHRPAPPGGQARAAVAPR